MSLRFLTRSILPLFLLLIFTLLTIACIHDSVPLAPRTDTYIQSDKVDFAKANSYWTARIRAVGPNTAHEEFTRAALPLQTSQAHVLAHVFGESLFSVEGASGLVYCDTLFLYGCFHQLIGSAISSLGISVVDTFATGCEQKPQTQRFSCLHGMGHGILGYYGYSLENLNTGLEICSRFDSGNMGNACARGMFMEYNFHELAARETGNIVDPRPLSLETKYTPCETISEQYRTACYIELPNWWVTTNDAALSTIERFEQAGSWCAAISHAKASQSCFEGLGHITPPATNLDAAGARALCESTSAVTRNRLYCLSSAVRRFKLEGSEDTAVLCKEFGLKDEALTYCQNFAS